MTQPYTFFFGKKENVTSLRKIDAITLHLRSFKKWWIIEHFYSLSLSLSLSLYLSLSLSLSLSLHLSLSLSVNLPVKIRLIGFSFPCNLHARYMQTRLDLVGTSWHFFSMAR